ncbi:ABC transporter ATP-binding protein/permease [Lentilactobacillus diolivorans]|uniref:ABC transporter ATP-binding protein n=1 Tax=Lentilactobacillus diolivorans TaxID=179838 RepID=UPI0024683F55|nr:ABC transporter ATP-binding protein [Lentilactobacillus diolivorans]MDH5105660.1 ABC transporter ATP-binding protein/permease [Lentilactobacillus diolivorans]
MLRYCFRLNKVISVMLLILIPVASLIEVLVAKLLQLITDTANGKEHIQYVALVLIVLGYIFVDALFYYFKSYYQEKWLNKVSAGVRADLIARYLDPQGGITQSLELEDNQYNQLTNNMTMLQNDYLRSFINIYGQLSQFSIAVMLSIFIQPMLCLMIIVLCLPGLLLPVINRQMLRSVKHGVLESSSAYTQILKNILEGLETIQLFNVNGVMQKCFDQYNTRWLKTQNKDQRNRKLVGGISQLVDNFLYLGTWVGGIYFVMKGSLSLGQLIAFSQLMVFISEPIQLSSELITDLIGGREVASVILRQLMPKNHLFKKKRVGAIQKIQFCNVTYQDSHDHRMVLRQVNLQLLTNRHYLIIGKTGSGKSTLIRLLLTTRANYQGKILINGIELNKIDDAELRSQIGVGEQNGHIFSATLGQNLTLFERKYATSELIGALNQVSLHKFANKASLDKNILGEGSELSGGEMKRLYTARALLDKHQFLIFDEPVSGLDPKTAQSIEQVLTNLEVGWVTITHHYNPKLFKFANEVIVIDNGTIAAEGKVGDPHVKLWLQRLNLVTN